MWPGNSEAPLVVVFENRPYRNVSVASGRKEEKKGGREGRGERGRSEERGARDGRKEANKEARNDGGKEVGKKGERKRGRRGTCTIHFGKMSTGFPRK